MRKYLPILLTLLFLGLGQRGRVEAQYTPPAVTEYPADIVLTQHWAMPTLNNPAATGDIDYIRIRGGARLDYLGSHQSPKNFLVTADSPFKLFGKRIGAGIVVNSQSFYIYRNLNVGAQGSYKLKIKNSTLSVGLQIGYYHTKFKGTELVINTGGNTGESAGDTGDETGGETGEDTGTDSGEYPDYDGGYDGGEYDDYPTQDVGAGVFDISLGVRYEHPKFYVGLSGLHLTGPMMKLSTEGETATNSRYFKRKLRRSLYFETGGNIPLKNTLITLQPSMALASDFKEWAGVLDLRATYNGMVTFGLDYRYNRAFGILAGLTVKDFFIGYNWEYDYRNHPKYTTGNHEMVIGYQLKLDMGGKSNFRHRSIRIM